MNRQTSLDSVYLLNLAKQDYTDIKSCNKEIKGLESEPCLTSCMTSTTSDSGAAPAEQNTTFQNDQELMQDTPKDRFHLVYLIMMTHGVAVLTPWNMFINAKDYFENYKLDGGNTSSSALLDYRTNFMSYVGMASQYPCFTMNLINLFVQCHGNTLGLRIVSGISVTVVMLVVTVILAVLDTSSWPETFFWITMATAVVINAAVGIYQNSVFGIAAVLPMKYTNAVIFGNNISGTLVAVTNIIVLVSSPSKQMAAIYYFIVAIAILIMAFAAYFITSHCKFYNHYVKLAEMKKLEYQEKTTLEVQPYYRIMLGSFCRIFKQIYYLMFGVWFTFFITLALFPAVMSDVKPVSINMSDEFWTAIFCFLCFNVFAMLGNLMTEFIKWPNSRWINVLVILRVVFIPLMLLANFRPEKRSFPVYIPYDGVFIASAVIFSLTNGYCSSLTMMYAPKRVEQNDSGTAGMMMAIFLVFGVLCGINFSRVWGPIIGSG